MAFTNGSAPDQRDSADAEAGVLVLADGNPNTSPRRFDQAKRVANRQRPDCRTSPRGSGARRTRETRPTERGMSERPISEIRFGPRHRIDLGDIDGLAARIRDVGALIAVAGLARGGSK